jgi:hypothetical protein
MMLLLWAAIEFKLEAVKEEEVEEDSLGICPLHITEAIAPNSSAMNIITSMVSSGWGERR